MAKSNDDQVVDPLEQRRGTFDDEALSWSSVSAEEIRDFIDACVRRGHAALFGMTRDRSAYMITILRRPLGDLKYYPASAEAANDELGAASMILNGSEYERALKLMKPSRS